MDRVAIEPLGVIDDNQQRLLLGHFRQEDEDRERDQKPIRRIAGAQAERDAERVALRV